MTTLQMTPNPEVTQPPALIDGNSSLPVDLVCSLYRFFKDVCVSDLPLLSSCLPNLKHYCLSLIIMIEESSRFYKDD